MISVCQWWSCTYIDFFCLSITRRDVKLWPFDWKCKLHVLACELSWGLNVDHWLVAVIVSLFAVLSLCSGSAHAASCTTHVFDQVFFFSCPFLIHSALVFTPLKGYKGCFVISYANTGRCCKEMLLLLFECSSSPGCMILFFCSCWYSSVKDDFQGLCRPKCFAFCFWSVAKCLPNTDCAQQWIKKGPLF